MKDLSIYIHIPFCKEKCYYCDFLSFRRGEDYFEDYIKALLNEIDIFANTYKNIYKIKTIFIGGGTPSILPTGYIGKIMNKLSSCFFIEDDAECTIEANPGTLTYDKINHYKQNGINRISLGLQAYQNDILKNIGRIHTKEEFLKNYELIRKVGFNNVNVDIMFSLPNQTLEDFNYTINKIKSLDVEHISVYSLILEENTKFYDMYKKGEFVEVDEKLDRKFYHNAIDSLTNCGYNMYEISNFSKKDRECKHNIVYWERGEYVGFGLGASSLLEEKRIKNTENISEYIKGNNKKEIEKLSLEDRQSEFIFLGLRMNKGISKHKFYDIFNQDIKDVYGKQIDRLILDKLIIEDGDNIKLSKKGLDLANTVFVEFI